MEEMTNVRRFQHLMTGFTKSTSSPWNRLSADVQKFSTNQNSHRNGKRVEITTTQHRLSCKKFKFAYTLYQFQRIMSQDTRTGPRLIRSAITKRTDFMKQKKLNINQEARNNKIKEVLLKMEQQQFQMLNQLIPMDIERLQGRVKAFENKNNICNI